MSSNINWMGKYMVNEQKYEREREVQHRIDRDKAFAGSVREGFVTSLFLGNVWGEREGLDGFLATNWNDKLGDTFDALHEHYFVKDGDDYRLNMPKDYEELERVARLFRETYIGFFIWHCMVDVRDGFEPTVWHALADYVEEAQWLPDHYHEIWGMGAKDGDQKDFMYRLWEVFFDRVYGRSRKFNFPNFVAANSALCMLEERYYAQYRDVVREEQREEVSAEALAEKKAYEKTVKEVEDIINGKDNSR